MAERQAAVITPLPPIHLPYSVRLRKLHHQQPKVTVADVPLDRPVDLVVLATKTTGATCRLQGREGVLTLRADPSARRQLPLCIGANYVRASDVAPNR